jgi:hypothetical protein
MSELKDQWFLDMEIIKHCKRNNTKSRFKNWLVENGHADKGLLDWEIKEDIVSYWKDKYPKTGDGPFQQYTSLHG